MTDYVLSKVVDLVSMSLSETYLNSYKKVACCTDITN